MTRAVDHNEYALEHHGYVVPRPLATDAIGLTLRAAFINESPLPDDMKRAIDTITRRDCN